MIKEIGNKIQEKTDEIMVLKHLNMAMYYDKNIYSDDIKNIINSIAQDLHDELYELGQQLIDISKESKDD